MLSRTARRAVVVDRGHAAELQQPGRGRPAPERARARTPRTGGHARSPPAASKAARQRQRWPPGRPELCQKRARYSVSMFPYEEHGDGVFFIQHARLSYY